MNLKEAMEIAKVSEAHYKAFAKISEFLTEVSEYSNTAAKSEKRLASLRREIEEMEAQKAARQAEIVKQHKESIESGEKIINNLKMEAKSIAASVAEAKASVSKDIDELALRKGRAVDQINEEINKVSLIKAGLGKEIDELTQAKATLEAEIKLMKEKVASFLN